MWVLIETGVGAGRGGAKPGQPKICSIKKAAAEAARLLQYFTLFISDFGPCFCPMDQSRDGGNPFTVESQTRALESLDLFRPSAMLRRSGRPSVVLCRDWP